MVAVFLTVAQQQAAGVAQGLSIAAPWDGQPLWWLQLLSLATLAVISEPDRSAASTTSKASLKPAMMRLRRGKKAGWGGVPGGYSESSRPPA